MARQSSNTKCPKTCQTKQTTHNNAKKFNSKPPKQSQNQIFSEKVIPENKINQKLIYIYTYLFNFDLT
jgi:hypothetical protein